MHISLPDLGSSFSVKGLNEGNNFWTRADADSFAVSPGTYLLAAEGKTFNGQFKGVIGLNEFVAPPPTKTELLLRHEPAAEVAAGKSFTMYVLLTDTATVTLQLSRLGGGLNRNIPMTRRRPFVYTALIPSELLTPGQLNYRIIVQQGNDYTVYPGNVKGNPFAWDSYPSDTYKTNIVPANSDIGLYNAATDRNIFIYPSFRRNFQTSYITGDGAGEMLFRLAASQAGAKDVFGLQNFVGDKIGGRMSSENIFDKIIIRAKSGSSQAINARISLIDRDANSFSAYLRLNNELNDIEIPLSGFKADSSLLLPAAYPGFQPQWFKSSGSASVPVLGEIEKIEILAGPGLPGSAGENNIIVEIESVRIGKRK